MFFQNRKNNLKIKIKSVRMHVEMKLLHCLEKLPWCGLLGSPWFFDRQRVGILRLSRGLVWSRKEREGDDKEMASAVLIA